MKSQTVVIPGSPSHAQAAAKQKKRRKAVSFVGFILFLLPALLFFINVVVVPFISGIVYSLTDWDGFGFAGSNFVGFANYIAVLRDEKFLGAFGFSIQYALVMLILVNVIGFGLALLVTARIRSRNALRSIFFMPNLIGGLILGFIWQFIFSKLFVQIGEVTHLESFLFNWLTNETAAFWSLVIVGVWQQAGYVMIIYIAGLQSIPGDVMEAAQIDGAGNFQRLMRITVPLMIPSFTINLFVTLSNALKQYDINLSLTNGGPYGSTEMVAMNIYQTAYKYNDFAEAQAKAIVFFFVIMVVTLLQVNLTKRKEVSM